MIQQLSVFIQNEIGSLAGVTTVLKENTINIRAISSFDTPEFTILRMVVDQPVKAKEQLINKGYAVKMSDAIAVELVDKPGVLNQLFRVIADNELAINYIYSFVIREGKAPWIIVNTEDLKRTKALLIENGFQVAGQEEM